MDTIYAERANGRIEVWTYVEGERYYLRHQASRGDVEAYARINNHKVVWVA
jgi:hypothetical protein